MIKAINKYEVKTIKINLIKESCIDENNIQLLKSTLENKILEDGNIKIENKFQKQDMQQVNEFQNLFIISKKFKDVFDGKLKGSWYPTNKKNYYLFLLENKLSSLNIEKTKVLDNSLKSALNYYTYSLFSYYDPVFQDHIEFTEYLYEDSELKTILSTDKFQRLMKENNLKGLIFNKPIWGTDDFSFYFFDSSTEDGVRNCYREISI